MYNRFMKIAIIGAGFTGLSAGFKLSKAGHEVTIFEKDSSPGGLASGFKDPKWQWALDKYYRHCFTNDNAILSLAKELNHPIITKRPETAVYVNDKFYKLDSPIDVLKFPELSLIERFRMGITIALLKYNPYWKPLEKYKVSVWLPKMMGEKPYELLWKPLIIKKFGPYFEDISLAWFWARIVKRTPSLAYPEGGFLEFANSIASEILKKGGKVLLSSEVKEIKIQKNKKIKINNLAFDKVIATTSASTFVKMTPRLPDDYKQKLLDLKMLSAVILILRLKKTFFQNRTYWLNICDTKSPLTGIVEHTNFIDKKYYNNEHLVYLLNYFHPNHPFLQKDKNELLKIYDPFLRRINSQYETGIIDFRLFSDKFAQPIIPTNYSKIIPPLKTPLPNVYLANMQQVYPWDRGTNYAVELGEKVADVIIDS